MNYSEELRAKKVEIEMKASQKLTDLQNKVEISDEERSHGETEVRRMLAEADGIEARAALAEDMEKRQRAMEAVIESRRPSESASIAGKDDDKRDAYIKFLRGDLSEREVRAMGIATDGKGGYTAPSTTQSAVQVALAEALPMVSSNVINYLFTDNGNSFLYNSMDDRAGRAYIIAEGADASETDVTLSQRELGAFKYTTGVVNISRELLQDSNTDIEALVLSALTRRMERTLNDHFTNGNGTSQPRGLLTAINSNAAFYNTTVANAVSSNDLIKLQHKAAGAYRNNEAWMISDKFLEEVRLLKDERGDYLWTAGISDGLGQKILGKPFYVNPDMTYTANSVVASYGDHKGYTGRFIRDLSIKRSEEHKFESDQVSFVGFARFDGDVTDIDKLVGLKLKA